MGHQIRSYVLQPHQLAKDLCTNVERIDPQKLLNGDLLLAASLAARSRRGSSSVGQLPSRSGDVAAIPWGDDAHHSTTNRMIAS